MDRLLNEGLPYQLVIVSKMTYGDWASRTTSADHEAALKIIRSHPERITLHNALPYAQVLDVFRHAHIGVLPTWADSYGYSVLEAQSAGCAVISTNLRALPEINSEDRGWLLQMPLNEWQNGRIHTDAEREIFRTTLEQELEKTLRHIAAHPGEIAAKAARAHASVKEHHSPASRASLTEAIYDAALGV
jgi:glycosyltransferase involved in cell wall biosynthesis